MSNKSNDLNPTISAYKQNTIFDSNFKSKSILKVRKNRYYSKGENASQQGK